MKTTLRCVAISLLFGACSSLPPLPAALPLHDVFAIDYQGRVGPLVEEQFGEVTPAEAVVGANAAVTFHVTVLELPIEEARQLVPALICDPPPPVEPLADGEQRHWGERRVNTGTISPDGFRGSSVPRVRALGMQGGHVDMHALRVALRALERRGRVREAAHGPVTVGAEVTLAAVTQMTFVKAMHFAAVHDSFLCDDLELGRFDHGDQVNCRVTANGDGFDLEIQWWQRTPVEQHATAAGLQLPVLASHRVAARATVGGDDGLVLGTLPGRTDGAVQLLCVEVARSMVSESLR